MTSNSLTENEEHNIPSQILKTILGLHASLSGEPDYFGRNKISSGCDLSHYSSASLY